MYEIQQQKEPGIIKLSTMNGRKLKPKMAFNIKKDDSKLCSAFVILALSFVYLN